jgi:hypothetical protein
MLAVAFVFMRAALGRPTPGGGGTLGTPLVMRGSNLVLNVEREGSYEFVLDARNSEAPVLTVTRSGTL